MPLQTDVERVMHALSPEARAALEVMAQAQNRPIEDVLRDEIRNYIAGKIPAIDIDSAISSVQATAYEAGYLIGRLKRFAREWTEND